MVSRRLNRRRTKRSTSVCETVQKSTNEIRADHVPMLVSARDRETIMNDTKSPELKALTYKFLAFHLGSYVCNLVTVGATVCYAVCIAARGL